MNSIPLPNYALPTLSERLAYTHSHAHLITPLTAEKWADYILHLTPEKPQSQFNAALTQKEIPTENSQLPEPIKNHYTRPKPKIHWEDFPTELTAIDFLKQLSETAPSRIAHKLRKWRLELLLDVGLISAFHRNTIGRAATPFTQAPEIDLDEFIDYSNAFRIKQILAHYSALKQSENSVLFMDYVDQIIDNTPLKPWQRFLLQAKVESMPQISIGVELARTYNKIISPSYMSQSLRAIYSNIAKQANIEKRKAHRKHAHHEWHKCSHCGKMRWKEEFTKSELSRAELGKTCKCQICRAVK